MDYSLRNSEAKDQAWLEDLRRDVYKDLFDLTWGGWDEERHQRHFSSFLEDEHIQVIEVSGAPVGVLQIFKSENELVMDEVQITPAY